MFNLRITTSIHKICLNFFKCNVDQKKKSFREFFSEALGYLHTIRDMAVIFINDPTLFCLMKVQKKTAGFSAGS